MNPPEAPAQTEMVELVPNGKHVEGLCPVALSAVGTERCEGGRPSHGEAEGFLPQNASKETHFTDFEGKTSFGMSVFNLSNAIMGSGILGLAYAMANTGILLFLFLLTCVALLSSYSIHLLLKSSGIVGIRAYEQLGFRAFGTPGKLMAAIAITLQNIGAMSSYLYIVKSEVPLVIQTFLNLPEKTSDWYMNGNYLVILVSITIILPLALMRQLGYLGYSSGFSLSCMVFFLIAVIYKKFQIPCPLSTFSTNITGNTSHMQIVMKDSVGGDPLIQASNTDSCAPSFFTLNTQVCWGQLGPGGWGEQAWGQSGPSSGGPGLDGRSLSTQAKSSSQQPLLPSTDSLHHPNHGLRLRLPPRSAAHLHRAQGPHQAEDAAHLQLVHRRHVCDVFHGCPVWLPHLL
uniref:Solute carrier family 38 member 3 n=1 Tax=Sarcophilus harrisii TaxID=9305 RepID=G3X2G3_SARHA